MEHSYNLRSFSLKRDAHTGVYRMTLTGDRAPDQIPLQALRAVPRPAEMDDWRLCEMIEEQAMRNAGREAEFAKWKQAKIDKLDFFRLSRLEGEM